MSDIALNRPPLRRSFARRLSIRLLPLIAIPVLILGMLVIWQVNNFTRDMVSATLAAIGESQSAEIDRWFTSLPAGLAAAAGQPEMISIFDTLLQEQARGNPISEDLRESLSAEISPGERYSALFDHFLITSPEGRVLLSSQAGWEQADLSVSGDFSRLTSFGRPIVSLDPNPVFETGGVVFTATPVLNESGRSLGYLVGITGDEKLGTILQDFSAIHPAARHYLVSAGGEFIGLDSSPDPTSLAGLTPAPAQAAALEAMVAQGLASEVFSFASFDDRPSLASVHRLAAVDLLFAVQLPESALLGGLDTSILLIGMGTLVTIVVLVFLVRAVIRRTATPLHRLSEAVAAYSPGDKFEVIEPLPEDEVGQLGGAFQRQAEEMAELYQSMQVKVDARARQMRTAAEIAQEATAASEAEEVLSQAVRQIVHRFAFYHAAVYLTDPAGKFAVLRHASGAGAEELLGRGHRVAAGSNSIVGWVVSNQQAKVSSDTLHDPIYSHNEFLPLAKSEAGFPLSARGETLGALDVQSSDVDAFTPEIVDSLQILAGLVASALVNARLIEKSASDLQQASSLYRSGKSMVSAETREQVNQVIAETFKGSLFSHAFYVGSRDGFSLFSWMELTGDHSEGRSSSPPAYLSISPDGLLEGAGEQGMVILDTLNEDRRYRDLQALGSGMGWTGIAILPVVVDDTVDSIVLVGAPTKALLADGAAGPLAELIGMAGRVIGALRLRQSSRVQMENLGAISRLIQDLTDRTPEGSDLIARFTPALSRVRDLFHVQRVALYLANEEIDSLELKVVSGEGSSEAVRAVVPFGDGPAGRAASSRTLLTQIVSPVDRPTPAGAGSNGQHTVSAYPIIYGEKVLGVVTLERRGAPERFLPEEVMINAFVKSMALILSNDRLIQRQRMLFDVTSRISRSAELGEVMQTTVQELGEILRARRVHLKIGAAVPTDSNGDLVAD